MADAVLPAEAGYRVLYDYGTYEGMKFGESVHDTVDAAVKEAACGGNCTRFLIVRVVDWQAVERSA